MRIVFCAPILRAELTALAARQQAELVAVDGGEALRREVADADALWIWPSFYDAALVPLLARHAQRLRWVQLATMGYDPVEAHGAPPGVTITSAGESYAPTVAEHALALLLALLRRLPESLRAGEQRRWDPAIAGRIGTLNEARVAVLGFGPIGREIALRLRACGARVVAISRSGGGHPLADEAFPSSRLHEALAGCDALIVAAPLTAHTRRLIDAAALAALPPHALLVNIARGGLVDHAALRDALDAGRLGGAALDVTEPEPLPPDDPLWNRPDVIVTPHAAGYGGTFPARRLLALVERNLRAYRSGRPLEAMVPVERFTVDRARSAQ